MFRYKNYSINGNCTLCGRTLSNIIYYIDGYEICPFCYSDNINKWNSSNKERFSWQCLGCGNHYSPDVKECPKCNKK